MGHDVLVRGTRHYYDLGPTNRLPYGGRLNRGAEDPDDPRSAQERAAEPREPAADAVPLKDVIYEALATLGD